MSLHTAVIAEKSDLSQKMIEELGLAIAGEGGQNAIFVQCSKLGSGVIRCRNACPPVAPVPQRTLWQQTRPPAGALRLSLPKSPNPLGGRGRESPPSFPIFAS